MTFLLIRGISADIWMTGIIRGGIRVFLFKLAGGITNAGCLMCTVSWPAAVVREHAADAFPQRLSNKLIYSLVLICLIVSPQLADKCQQTSV